MTQPAMAACTTAPTTTSARPGRPQPRTLLDTYPRRVSSRPTGGPGQFLESGRWVPIRCADLTTLLASHFTGAPVRTTLWRIHLGGGCLLAVAYVYLPLPALRVGSLIVLCLATFAAGEAVGFVAGSLGSSATVTRAGGSVAAAALTMVAYLIGIAGYAVLIHARSPGRDRASLIDATVISTGVGMLAWVFLAAPYSA